MQNYGFMTQNTTLRANFMWNKYYKKHIPTLAEWKGRSQLWKNVLHNKECIEKFQWWETKSGISSVWYDNRTQLGPLYTYQAEVQTRHSLMNIDIFLKETRWDYNNMHDHLHDHIVEHIIHHMYHNRRINMDGDQNKHMKVLS